MLVRPELRFKDTLDAVDAVAAFGHVAQGELGVQR